MSLEIVLGPMFSGKSSHALAYARRNIAIGKKVLIIKPNIDNRYSNEQVMITHDNEQIPCITWDVTRPILPTQVIHQNACIIIEEAQFFKGLKSFVTYVLKAYGRNVMLVGLDGDARQNPFGELLECIPFATSVTKLHALCMVCKNGTIAPFTKKKNDDGPQIDVGGADMYLPVCLKHL
jgi:thymidine kinase